MIEQEYNFLQYVSTVEETEEYLRAVVNSKYSNVNASCIFEALALAHSAHKGQFRCDNTPYIIHPMRVAMMLLKYERNTIPKVFIASLLHDILEKTSLTDEEIAKSFGSYVAKLVRSITRYHDEKQSHQEKTEAKWQNWQNIMSGSHEARAIKVFEDLDNMICWKAIPEGSPYQKKIPRWLTEAEKMSLSLAHATNMEAYTLMRQEYEYYVKQGFADQPITI